MSVRKRILYVFLAVLFAVTTLKILFTGYDIDEQYAVSLAGRLLKGDLLLADMWEPHQTSAWLCTLLLLPYVALFHTTTGIFLYLRFCGLLIHAAVGAFLYKTLTHFIERERALLIGCIYFFTLPKLMFLPEFSNIQVWCLLAAILCLLRYYGYSASRPGSRRLYCLVLAGCFLTLEVLSYPSTIFAFAACLCGMICYRRSPRSLLREKAVLDFRQYIICRRAAARAYTRKNSRICRRDCPWANRRSGQGAEWEPSLRTMEIRCPISPRGM